MKVPDGVFKKKGELVYLYCEAAKKIVHAKCKDLPESYRISISGCSQSYNPQQDVIEVRMDIFLGREGEYDRVVYEKALKVMHKIPSDMPYKSGWGRPFEATLRLKRSNWVRRLGTDDYVVSERENFKEDSLKMKGYFDEI